MTPFIRLHPADDVLIARAQLVGGTTVENVTARGLIPPGHKIAMRNIAPGEPVRRYNQIIGFASKPIAAGEHVHTHNLWMGPEGGAFARDYAFGADVKPEPPKREATFMGIKRADGRVATRNYIGVLSSVNCSATAARAIADHFSRLTNPKALEAYPSVDGVVALAAEGVEGGSGMWRKLRVDPQHNPVLEWRWRVPRPAPGSPPLSVTSRASPIAASCRPRLRR